MTKTEFQQLKTPVILRDRCRTTGVTNYFRTTGISIGELLTIHFDLQVSKVTRAGRSHIYIFFELNPLSYQFLEPSSLAHLGTRARLTAVPWKQAKREILDLLLGK